jgi:hypothetical protein
MRTIKSKAKQFELAEKGLLFFIENGRYVRANVGTVISQHGILTFYAKAR